MNTTTQGKSIPSSIPWSDDFGGFLAVEHSFTAAPMKPGERRTLRALAPGSNQVGTVELVARGYESVKLLGGTYELLRIDNKLTLPDGQSLRETLWADRTGEVLRRQAEAMDLESFRTTKAVALDTSDQGRLDLGESLSIKVSRPLARPHATRRVRYRLHIDDGDPAAVFATGPSQRVKSIDPHTAEVTVNAIRPDQPGNTDAPDDPPTKDDRQPNNFIQSDNPKIVALAREAAGDEKDPWRVAVALERQVKSWITKNDYTQAFATAAEVVESHAGDCTEHAVLLAALARARSIPARVVIGLVYMEGYQAFGYHLWDEVYIRGRWIPLDSTLGQGGTGAAHLKLAHSSLQGASAYSSFLPVAHVAGKLKIEVEEAE